MIIPDCNDCEKINNGCTHVRELYNCQTIQILRAALDCIKRQYEDICTIGSSKCITCNFNCKQATLRERIDAYEEAIGILKEKYRKDKEEHK